MENITNQTKASILIDALPNIQRYNKKIVVVKYGGNAMIDENLKESVMRDIVMLSTIGVKVVLVHGGGPEINQMLKRLNIEPKFIGGLRYTDDATIEVVQMVLGGKLNKNLVNALNMNGGKALGLCGIDGQILQAKKMNGEVDLGNVGEITGVNSKPIIDALDNGYIPVIATLGVDENGNVLNINADTAASKIASELNASNMILMTDVVGLLMDKDDPSTLISQVKLSQVPSLKKKGIISGGMIPKIDCCVEAVRRGVGQAIIIDGRVPHSILIEMLTGQGIGTLFK